MVPSVCVCIYIYMFREMDWPLQSKTRMATRHGHRPAGRVAEEPSN